MLRLPQEGSVACRKPGPDRSGDQSPATFEIRDADAKGVLDLGAEVRRLGDGAKSRTLGPEELTGQTFTVSNIGAVGGGQGTPIVPYGTTAILSVGRAQEKVVAVDGDLAIAPHPGAARADRGGHLQCQRLSLLNSGAPPRPPG